MNWHRHGRKIVFVFLLLLVAAMVAGILVRKSGNLPSVVLKDGKVI